MRCPVVDAAAVQSIPLRHVLLYGPTLCSFGTRESGLPGSLAEDLLSHPDRPVFPVLIWGPKSSKSASTLEIWHGVSYRA